MKDEGDFVRGTPPNVRAERLVRELYARYGFATSSHAELVDLIASEIGDAIAEALS